MKTSERTCTEKGLIDVLEAAEAWPTSPVELRSIVERASEQALNAGDGETLPLRCIFTWLETAAKGGRRWPEDTNRLAIEMDHSARGGLLGWLIAGNEPFPEPPPLIWSRPAFELIRDGVGHPFEVFEDEWHAAANRSYYGFEFVIIDQHPWRLVERIPGEDPAWIVQPFQGGAYHREEEAPRLGSSLWVVYCIGHNLDKRGFSSDKLWELRRFLDGVVLPVIRPLGPSEG